MIKNKWVVLKFRINIILKASGVLNMILDGFPLSPGTFCNIQLFISGALSAKVDFNFYTGPGLGIGYANFGYGEDQFYGAVVADIGIDYTFEWPFQIGLKWVMLKYRPGWSKAREKIGNDIEHQISFAL